MSAKGSLKQHHAEKPQWMVVFHPETAVLSMEYDRNLDVVVHFRHNGRKSHSIVRVNEYGERYFLVSRRRVYFTDLRKVVTA